MADILIVALLAGGVTLSAAYINSIVAEGYRRHRDGSALAAGLLGELSSYETAWPMLEEMLKSVIEAIDQHEREQIFFRTIERPKDRFYDDVVGKLGTLGPDIVEGLVYVYGNIVAFRIALEVISRDYREMSDFELRHRCVSCKDALNRAVAQSGILLPALRKRASKKFFARG